MRELGHTKVTTTQIYADFEDTVDIEKEFPSITKPSNVPIFSKEDTLLEDTSDIGPLYVTYYQFFTAFYLCSVKPEVASSSLVGPALKSNNKHSSIKISIDFKAF